MTTFTTLGKDEAGFQLALRFHKIEARLAHIEAFLTNGAASWPMSVSPDQAHTSKTDDKAVLAELLTDG